MRQCNQLYSWIWILQECNIVLNILTAMPSLFAKYMYNGECLCTPPSCICCFLFVSFFAIRIYVHVIAWKQVLWTQSIGLHLNLLFWSQNPKVKKASVNRAYCSFKRPLYDIKLQYYGLHTFSDVGNTFSWTENDWWTTWRNSRKDFRQAYSRRADGIQSGQSPVS